LIELMMDDSKKEHVKHIDWKLTLAFGIIEAFALFFIALLGIDTTTEIGFFKKIYGGILVGIFSSFFPIFIFNIFSNKFNLILGGHHIKKIGYFAPMLLNGLFLAFLFAFESSISSLKKFNLIIGNSIVAAIVMLLIIPVTLLIYNNLPDKRFFKINFTSDKKYFLVRLGLVGATTFGLIYEIIALPIMAYLDQIRFLYFLIGRPIGFGLIGFISGFVSSFIAILIYNRFLSNKVQLEIRG